MLSVDLVSRLRLRRGILEKVSWFKCICLANRQVYMRSNTSGFEVERLVMMMTMYLGFDEADVYHPIPAGYNPVIT